MQEAGTTFALEVKMMTLSDLVLVLVSDPESLKVREQRTGEMALVVAPWLCFPEGGEPTEAAHRIDQALVRSYSEVKKWKKG